MKRDPVYFATKIVHDSKYKWRRSGNLQSAENNIRVVQLLGNALANSAGYV